MTSTNDPDAIERRAWRASWLLASVWLVFAVLPLVNLWAGDMSRGRQVAGTVAIGAFCVLYAAGFRHVARREVFSAPGATADRLAVGVLIGLIALNVIAFAIGGWAMLGLVPFIPAFAVFNVSWRWVIAVIGASLTAVILPPALAGVLDDLWPIAPAVATAALATSLGRLAEERSRERTRWQTELLLSDDRNRVARDVHDVLGHSLTAVVLKAELSQRLLEKLDPTDEDQRATVERCRAELDELQGLSRRALAEIRSTVGGLRNPNLADEIAAARTVLADAGVTYTAAGESALVPPDVRGPLAWTVRESITNIVRHAGATHCTVTVAPTADVWLRVDDDGVGPHGIADGNGLTGLRERLDPLGAELAIEPITTGGTRLEVRRG